MKIIHCADIHLDSKMNANLNRNQARERKAELLTTFRRMMEYAAENGVEAILIAGDLFDTKNVSATARNLVRDAVLSHPEIGFYYLQGNHDEGSFAAGLEALPENLFLFGSSWTSYRLNRQGSITVTGIELNQENAGSIYHSLSLDMEKFNIVMLHGQEAQYRAKDQTPVIHLPELKNKGIDYLALGHIHSYKLESLDKRGVYCYPGCLEGRGFDECGEHGFVLLDVDEHTGSVRQEFVPFASRNLYTIQVDVTGCGTTSEILERLQQEAGQLSCSERSLVKFELTGSLDVEGEKDLEYLAKQFEDSFYFVKLKDCTSYRVDYKAFELDMSLKGEFIRTVMAREDLNENDKAVIIHFGIQALGGETPDLSLLPETADTGKEGLEK